MGAEEEQRLAFKHGHLAGQTGMAFAVGRKGGEGAKQVHLVTGGADCLACLRTEETEFKETETEINDHDEVITCLAANGVAPPTAEGKALVEEEGKGKADLVTDMFATGSEDRFVKLYAYPDAVFETNVTRFELPVRAVDFSPDGRTIAAGGDDQGIRLVELEVSEETAKGRKVACKLLRTLRTVGRSVKSIRWDPEGLFVAAVSADGTLQIWNSESGECVLTKKGAAKKFEGSSPNCAHISWHPEGIHLAVPSATGDVTFFERLSWEEEFVLPSSTDGEELGHSAAVTSVELSPNGLYAATAALDRRVAIWSVKDQKVISSRCSDSAVCNMKWHPFENALSLMDDEGNFAHWKQPVDPKLPDPFLVADEEEDASLAQNPSGAGPEGAGVDNKNDGIAGKKRKLKIVESDSEDSEDDFDHAKKTAGGADGRAAGGVPPSADGGVAQMMAVMKRKAHKPFQPGATPAGASTQNRRFLAYNIQGCVSTLRGPDYNSVEVVFHDVSARASRIPTLTDYFGFELGALGPKGTILASPEKGSGKPSVVMYRPFESWAVGSDWTCNFPSGEDVKAVTVGSSFAAAATQNFLRVYSLAGSPLMVLSLPGQILALAAKESHLVTVYLEDEVSGKVSFQMHDVGTESLVASGPMCLTPGLPLEWVGFSEDGILASWDGATLRGYFPRAYGGSWVPLFLSSSARKAETEHHHVVGLDVAAKEIFCIITRSSKHYPQVVPRPIITTMPLNVPIVTSEAVEDSNGGATHDLQQSLMFQRLDRLEGGANAAAGRQTTTQVEVQMDRTLLKLMHAAIKSDKCEMAFQYAQELNLQRSLQGALKLANVSKKRILSEKLSDMLSNRESVVAPSGGENIFSRKRVYGSSQ
ncbi:WD40 repeat domain-containing protein [Chloropicon primus]|uniref:WD40 repeat domain-containing protein n=1 Tax=Chloropicon primus TaxID=1764295 RepID=A0A5B8MX07_9CHLO|nr:WD40 repeat domain-containing protein [Chloropicon primus]|eukprot:QDZ24215.1 WD40 repeat domain-containing protein [Chloropicon primus]